MEDIEIIELETSLSLQEGFVSNDFETENNPIDTNSLLTQTDFVGDSQRENPAIPDAIQIDNGEENVAEQVSAEVQEDSPGQSGDLPAETAIDNIYKLLDERLPTRSLESESETESQSSESEITLKDLKESIDDLKGIESEQLEYTKQLESDFVISSNNNYHFNVYEIAIISAIWGSIAIYLFFRKIG